MIGVCSLLKWKKERIRRKKGGRNKIEKRKNKIKEREKK
jgi:hypothetical protein